MSTFSEIQKLGKNMYYIDELKKKSNIVPFIGAGVSSCCYPMWGEFLRKFPLTKNEKILLEELLQKGEFEEAASYIQTCTGENIFNITVKETFGTHHLKEGNIPTYMKLFPQLANNLIVTTNLDAIIERVYEIKNKNLKVITPDMQDQMNDAIVTQYKYLVKLHGSYEESTKYVLTKEQYNKAYGIDSENRIDFQNPFINILSRLMVSRTFLFLGCSLSSDRTLHVLQQIVSRFNKFVQHFAILEMDDEEEENIIRERNLAKYGIYVIWYPKGEYDAIDIIVNELFENLKFKSKQYDTLPKDITDLYGRDDEINRIKKK